MGSELTHLLVGGLFALLGSLITGYFNLRISSQAEREKKLMRSLRIAANDVIAFYELEERYTAHLSDSAVSAEAWKRKVRKELRGEGASGPSDSATPLTYKRILERLDE